MRAGARGTTEEWLRKAYRRLARAKKHHDGSDAARAELRAAEVQLELAETVATEVIRTTWDEEERRRRAHGPS